jgi:pimeloyl-ACP methyl ester carboxylesterase
MTPHLLAPVVAVDLPGRGSRPADLAAVTLSDCVQAVIDSAGQAGFERFVLVGHSLAGVTITETAWRHPERVAGLIYVAAAVPAPGASAAIAITGADMPPGKPHMPDEATAKAYFGNDLTDEQWAEHWKGLVPESAAIWNAQLSGYPDSVPSTYISMTDDVGVPPELAELMIANLRALAEHRVLCAGHTVMVSKPRELAAIINDVVGRAQAA